MGLPPAPALVAARCCTTIRSGISPPASAAKRSASGKRSATSLRRSITFHPRRLRARAKTTKLQCAPATRSASGRASALPPDNALRWVRICRRAGAQKSNSSNGLVVREGEKVGLTCRANEVLTDIVKRVERGELKPDPRHITELRLN